MLYAVLLTIMQGCMGSNSTFVNTFLDRYIILSTRQSERRLALPLVSKA